MFVTDRFEPEFHFEYLLFSLTLGLALGLVLAGVLLLFTRRLGPVLALGLVALGIVLGALSGILALDSGPANIVEFRMKPYLSEVAEAAVMVLGAFVGVLVAATAILVARRVSHVTGVVVAALAVAIAVGGSLAYLHAYNTRADGPHPKGTETGSLVEASRVIENLAIPTGLAVASNGDIAIVEFDSAKFRLYSPGASGFEQRIEVRLPIAEGRVGLHAAFHPGYPSEPVVFVTAEVEESGGRFMNVFRGRIQGNAVEFDALVQTLPLARREARGDHYGSAIAFCRGSLFVTVGDTEDAVFQAGDFGTDGVLRDSAQRLDSAIGKVLRYELRGSELEPAGLADSPFPIYAMGFRNPFGIACDERTGFPVVAENGSDGHDQLRLVPPGSNHEWPLSLDRDAFSEPLVDSGEAHLAPTGAAYRTANGGHELLFSAFFSQAIYALPFDAEGTKGQLRLLREVEGGAFNVATDAAGCVYFTDAESLWRLDDGRCH